METMQFTKEQAVGLFTLLPRTRFECAYLDKLISANGCLTLWVYAINRKTKLGANLLIRF